MKSLFIASLVTLLAAASVNAADMNNMRGERYGEVLLGSGGLLVPNSFDVYNTIGLNDCPEELWSKLDAEKLKKETGAKVVKLNGPRYWVIDGLTGSSLVNKEKRSFDGLDMRLAGTLELTMKDKMSLGKPYIIHQVARKTTWVFKAGKPVYQLIDPDGAVYFMQSFSAQKAKQDMDSLAKLGSKLTLPSGWKFRTLTLSKDFNLSAIDGMAYVVQDDLENTYQKSIAKESDKL